MRNHEFQFWNSQVIKIYASEVLYFKSDAQQTRSEPISKTISEPVRETKGKKCETSPKPIERPKSKRQRQEFNLDSVTQELTRDAKFEMVSMAAKHILTGSSKHSLDQTRHLMLTKIVAQEGGSLPYIIADLIEQQPKSRFKL